LSNPGEGVCMCGSRRGHWKRFGSRRLALREHRDGSASPAQATYPLSSRAAAMCFGIVPELRLLARFTGSRSGGRGAWASPTAAELHAPGSSASSSAAPSYSLTALPLTTSQLSSPGHTTGIAPANAVPGVIGSTADPPVYAPARRLRPEPIRRRHIARANRRCQKYARAPCRSNPARNASGHEPKTPSLQK